MLIFPGLKAPAPSDPMSQKRDMAHPVLVGVGDGNSRFPSGMTTRKATARATGEADSPEGNDRKKTRTKSTAGPSTPLRSAQDDRFRAKEVFDDQLQYSAPRLDSRHGAPAFVWNSRFCLGCFISFLCSSRSRNGRDFRRGVR